MDTNQYGRERDRGDRKKKEKQLLLTIMFVCEPDRTGKRRGAQVDGEKRREKKEPIPLFVMHPEKDHSSTQNIEDKI